MSDDRIEQFRKMAKANPDDDLAHFALGQALNDAGRHAEAVIVLRQVVKLNADYSRAYVLLGRSQAETGDDEGALEVWQAGYSAALRRGDLMVSNELAGLLRARGVEPERTMGTVGIDEPSAPVDDREPGPDEVRDHRTGRVGKKMSFDPFGDEIGAFIVAHISDESWRDWMEMSIKVVNELRLDLGDPEAQRTWDTHMRDYLNLPARLFEDKTYG